MSTPSVVKKILEERCKPHSYNTPEKYENTLKKILRQEMKKISVRKISSTYESIEESRDLTRIVVAIMRESNRLSRERSRELGREAFGG